MKNLNLKAFPLIILILIPFGIIFSPQRGVAHLAANAAVSWTPMNPIVGDTVTIQYNSTAGSLSPSTTLYLQWAFDFYGNKVENQDRYTPVLPSKKWYTPNSVKGYNGFFLATPMTNVTSEIWEVNITVVDDLPDRIRFYFSQNANGNDPRQGSQNSAFYIDPLFSTNGIFIIDPSIAETNFVSTSETFTVTVRGHSSTTSWNIQLGGRSTSPLSCSVSSPTFDSDSGLWTLTAGLPTSIDVGLYDLSVSASVDGTVWSDTEVNAIQIVTSYKNDYTIALIGDQEMNHHPGPNYAIDGIIHGNNNFSTLLEELSIVNPDLMVNLGSVTFWGDIETMQQYNEFIELSYDLPHVYVASHRDRFIGNEADWEYTGAGMGALEKIVGIRHKQWTYGDHYFASIYTGDHRMDQSELDWFNTEIGSSSGDLKFLMIHDPIGYETTYNPTGQNAIDETGRAALAPLVKSGKIDYYIHSSAGVEGSQQVTQTGAFHIGTKGAANGYYLLKISGDEITEWGYNGATDGPYPWYRVSTTFSGSNDGTEESATGTINNSLAEDLPGARIVFQMKAGNTYETDVGEVYSSYEKDGKTFVEIHVPVTAETVQSVVVSKSAPTNTTSDTTTTDTNGGGGAPGFDIIIGFFALVPIIVRRRKR